VLVVDDLRDQTDSLALLLALWGHRPLSAYDGPAALELASAHTPDVAIVDIGLPSGMDGCEVARQLRARPETAAVLLVAVTGYGQDHDVERCREAGFDHHILKPFDLRVLEQILLDFSAAASLPMGSAERRTEPGKPNRTGLLELHLRIRSGLLAQRAGQLLRRGGALRAKTQRLLGESAALRRLSNEKWRCESRRRSRRDHREWAARRLSG
jgi:CheY-like chemotaxis protein